MTDGGGLPSPPVPARSAPAPDPVFREATREDAAILVPLLGAFNASQGYPFDEARARRVLETMLATPTLGRVWLIVAGGDVVGYVALAFGFSLEYGGRDAFLDELFVRPAFRSRGLGRAAVSFALGEAARLGVQAVHLEVERANVAAGRLYASLGFGGNDRRMLTKRLAPEAGAAPASGRGRDAPGPDRHRGLPAACGAVFALVWLALAIAPRHRGDWLLENALTFVAVPALVAAYRRRRLSDRSWVQVTAFLVLHTIGSHYTYSEVPLGDWARDALDLTRNHYDRVVHFAFGLLLYRPILETTFPERRPGTHRARERYLCFTVVASWSLLYEVLEWLVAITADPAAGTMYLGTQGDSWDGQKDMALACAGALLAALGEARRRGNEGGPSVSAGAVPPDRGASLRTEEGE